VLGRRNNLEQGLAKTRQSFFGRIASLLRASEVTDETWDDLEALLIQADVGVATTLEIIEELRAAVDAGQASTPERVEALLRQRLVAILQAVQHPYLAGQRQTNVVMVVGVNGSGKTTSIAKLAHYHQLRGDKVLLAAADTFRAAAIDQLRIWAERLGVEMIAHQPGADPGAVVYDAIRACQARHYDVLIIDTAGRLHTKFNLMKELEKLGSIARKQVHQAPHETLLVVDATTGQNALVQATKFAEATKLTGVVLAKLDSTSKGGMAFALAHDVHLPVLFATTGEQVDDLHVFDPADFVSGLFV
jgi:fused signal recognition particle receptor